MQQSCIVCGNTYISKMKKKYCSKNCIKKAWRLLNREKYLNTEKQYRDKMKLLKPIKPPVELNCAVCEKLFIQSKRHPEQKCCSYKCSYATYRKNNPEKVALWKRIEKDRHKERYAKWETKYHDLKRFSGNRMRALKRDNFTCTQCLMSEPEVSLIVHHIDHSGQSPKPNNRIENLTTLCRACHIRLHLLDKSIQKHNTKI